MLNIKIQRKIYSIYTPLLHFSFFYIVLKNLPDRNKTTESSIRQPNNKHA